MSTNGISADALTDGLIFMALAMAVTRTVRLVVARGTPSPQRSDPGGPVVSFVNVVFYAGLLVLLVYRRVQGRPIATTKQLFLLPVIVTIIGFEDLSHAKLDAIDIVVAVAGCGLSLLFGLSGVPESSSADETAPLGCSGGRRQQPSSPSMSWPSWPST